MAEFKEFFDKKPAIFAVVSVNRENGRYDQTIRNTEIAYNAGFDGIFLMNPQQATWHPNYLLTLIHDQFPGLWAGLYFLKAPKVGVDFNRKSDGILLEDIGFDDSSTMAQLEAAQIYEDSRKNNWNGLYFGGIGFRSAAINGLHIGASYASTMVDVMVTGGEKPGLPPSLEKVRTLKSSIGRCPLAITGVSPDNINGYYSLADAFIVRSNLLKSPTEDFDPKKAREFVRALRS